MTDKQRNILDAALNLFALEGYNATSTSKIARAAHVSEGLIFRHFGSKEGLLKAIVEEGAARASTLFEPIYALTSPQAQVEAIIQLPFQMPASDYDYWRLQYKLKWELQHRELSRVLDPLKVLLEAAFEALEYTAPEAEAAYLLHHFDGVTSALLKNEIQNPAAVMQHWLAQYH